jgi:hypothetical protein
MKNLLFIAIVVFVVSCSPKETESLPVERSIGFNTFLPEKKWHLGTDQAIQVVRDLDVVWAKKDYAAMKGFFADTAKCYFPDGRIATSPDQFIEFVKSENEGSDVSWTFDYAFSVDLDPTMGGEHVQAGFTVTVIAKGDTALSRVHESYYIIDGKIVMWNQYKMLIK